MNTINCRIKLNDHADVAGVGITPAEVIILRKLHDHHAGGNCILNPVAAGKAMTFIPPADEEGGQPEVRDRTDAEEYARLRRKYPQREAPDKPNSSFIDPLFPGIATGTGRLPQAFNELPPQYAIGEIGVAVAPIVRTYDKAEPIPVSESQAAALVAEKAIEAENAQAEAAQAEQPAPTARARKRKQPESVAA